MNRLTMNRLTSLIPGANTAQRGRPCCDLLLVVEAGVALTLTIFLLIVSFAFTWPDLPLHDDFIAFWTGGWLVRDGAGPTLFNIQQQATVQAALRQAGASEAVRTSPTFAPFVYPPPVALLFAPLTLLPVQGAFLLWLTLSVAAFVSAVAVQLRGTSHGRGIAVMLLTFGGVTFTLLEGQVNAVLVLALSLAMLAFRREKRATGGALLGIMLLKFQYAAPFALLLLVKGRWRELAGMAGTGGVIGAVTLAMIGPAGIMGYLELIHRMAAFSPPAEVPVHPWAMVNWRGMLTNLWPGVPDGVGTALVVLLALATILVVMLAWRGEWDPGSPVFARQMLALTLATILASPHSHFHEAVLVLAPLAALLARSPAGVTPVAGWRTLLVGGLLLSVVLVPFVAQRWLFGPYLLLALAMLLLGHSVPQNEAPTSNVGVEATPAP
ncbi:MAG: DUF2029 domain-containing protein [Actinobacteria bacterium]|nr:DUF2029 domain-containing protein [Actinomycetota bacterium]